MPRKPATEPKRSRPVRVADQIKGWVVAQRLKKGDRLPGESEMIERFGMAKGTIREAMRLLEAQGLVTTRTGPGGGSFVGEVSEERARALLGNYFYFKDLTVADIYQIRRALEPEVAASLAGKLSEADLSELEALISQYAAPAATPEEEREQHVDSLKFHAVLARHSGNALLAFLIRFMAQILSDLTVYRKLYAPHNRELWESGRNHQIALIAALREGRAGDARQIMADHMATAQRFMETQEAEVMKRFIEE
ncbi:FadR family transcriptional regulator [Thioclava sp. BHET1]|uniref:GntR family transcriptional regulator n=1 Tax=Thioclava dalianensis TaxID=1185766 RepID=A0A074TJ72_9RHOB|nr:FCD domain-containing protein [Thioclava dalianensis]KEP71689.1 GntR family transcriptional regulator [Thioclava dalianensis]TMV90100.1 FadR family transcriptional regulator [Thioclava sp. BHET1]SFN41019.1 DNA-binding transcriptional regulator, FadR family [Thioclava dalianensis]